ncbi:hypothetical protein HNY73_019267 [Argiope bruennichi]|uniref:Uncharacterized protein n=1 Tax=Argiope bruennichi TaxID=94029 RepID=A0A8T0EFK9_ARGBR|nr:hypothetical protein HNY73_019267 [Argiope bruennichi]
MEGPKDLEMMEESDDEIPRELPPEVKEILRTDKNLQAKIDEILDQMDLTRDMEDKDEGALQRYYQLTSLTTNLGPDKEHEKRSNGLVARSYLLFQASPSDEEEVSFEG